MDPQLAHIEKLGKLALICGLAPLALGALGMVPFLGCLTTPLLLVSIPCAVAFGVTAIVRGPGDYRGTSKAAIAGLVLGIIWLALVGGLVAWMFKNNGPHGWPVD